jgi:AcrR family transcriptional regulator
MPRKAGRPKTGQALLTQERILSAALVLVDEHGVAALTMRRLAAALGVDPMAIYRHLPDKRAVLAGLVQRVFAEFRVPTVEEDGWQAQVRAFAHAYRTLVRAHPHLVFYVATDGASSGEAALMAGEALYTALAGAGLPPQGVVRAADLLVDFLNGFALGDLSGRLGRPGERHDLLARLAELPASQYPTMHRVLGSLTVAELEASFETELEILIAGIEAMLTADC